MAFSKLVPWLAISALFRLATCLSVNIPLAPPSSASSVASDLISLSIEQDRWTDWVGADSQNAFFFNTLDNLKRLTGRPPQIRIGANSEDHTNFNAGLKSTQLVFPAISSTVPYPEATTIVVGNAYYQTARFLPPGTHVIWGLNLGQNNLTSAFLDARALVNAFKSAAFRDQDIVLDAIEIGNEADLYPNNGARAAGYTSTQYLKEWVAFATNVSAAIGLTPSSGTKLWAAGFAGSSHSTSGFSPQSLFSQGILSSAPGPIISTISQHHYSGSFCAGSGGLLQDLMTKSTIRGNLTVFNPDITVTRQNKLDYVLGETNSYSCHGAPGVSNSAGAAIWTLDYALFASQIGISRVFFHEGIGFKYNLIQPATLTRSTIDGSPLATPLPPHVQPQYYAAIVAAEAIGSSQKTRMVELSIANDRISGYAIYEDNALKRIVLINSQAFFNGATSRPTIHVDFAASGGALPQRMTVKRLFIPHADDTSGLLWGGQTFETADGRVAGTLSVETVDVRRGIDIAATEIVLLSVLV